MSLVVKRKKKDPSSRARLSLFSPFFRSKTRSIVPSRTRSKGRPLSNHAALFLPFARARRRIRICKILGPRFLNNLENARRGEARRNNWNETTFRVQWIIPPLRREEGWEFEWSTQGGRRELGLILGGWTNERRSEDRSGLTLIVLHKAPLFCSRSCFLTRYSSCYSRPMAQPPFNFSFLPLPFFEQHFYLLPFGGGSWFLCL